MGLSIAALTDCREMVKKEMNMTTTAARIKIHHSTPTWYAKDCSQLWTSNQATGEPTITAISTIFIKSPASNKTIDPGPAPSTLRMLTSLERFSARKKLRLNRPEQHNSMAHKAKYPIILLKLSLSLY